MKKLISFLLSAALCVGLCAVAVRADAPAALGGICSAEEWEVLRLTNAERLKAGLVPLSVFPALQNAAVTRKAEVASNYDLHHTRPDGTSCFTVLTEQKIDYRHAGENIAAGQRTPRRVLEAWMGSEGHRDNVMNAAFTHLGCGYLAEGFLGTSWVQMFVGGECAVESVSLSADVVTCAPGTSVDALGVAVKAVCSVHGDCWLPLDASMCSGYDPSKTGAQTVTVTYAGQGAILRVNVTDSALDVSGADGWAADWLTRADAMGLLSERNRTGFTGRITRVQFADLAVRLAETLTGKAISPAPDGSFTDSKDEAVLKAKAAGISSGYAAGSGYEFRPDNPITRQEICVMLAHASDYVERQRGRLSPLDRTPTIGDRFADRDEVADWAKTQVALMTANNVMGGKADGNRTLIAPLAETTVQEAVTLAVKLCDALK